MAEEQVKMVNEFAWPISFVIVALAFSAPLCLRAYCDLKRASIAELKELEELVSSIDANHSNLTKRVGVLSDYIESREKKVGHEIDNLMHRIEALSATGADRDARIEKLDADFGKLIANLDERLTKLDTQVQAGAAFVQRPRINRGL